MQLPTIWFFALLVLSQGSHVQQALPVHDHTPSALRGPGRNAGLAQIFPGRSSALKCHQVTVADSSSNKWATCPAECPVIAENKGDGISCNFRCVEATYAGCAGTNPKETVPDIERGICRACVVYGCDTCARDGTDTCGVCSSGFYLQNGRCINVNEDVWNVLYLILFLVTLFAVGWIIDLMRRPITNADAVKAALTARSRSKLRQPRDEGVTHVHGRELWPLNTNLLRENVAGLGITLQFNFAASIIAWATAVGVAWFILAVVVDTDLLVLGTRRAKTARQNCILVAWGYETQHRLMWTKVGFLAVLYIASFVSCFFLAMRQMRVSERVDAENSTHKDFAARIQGVPPMKGTEHVEDDMKRALSEATQQKVVGVSVAWDFKETEDELMDIIECDLFVAESQARIRRGSAKDSTGPLPQDTQTLYSRLERTMLCEEHELIVPKRKRKGKRDSQVQQLAAKEVDVHDILENLNTCPEAYVVFETEASRDAAVELAQQQGGLEYRGSTLKLSKARVEPQSVQWRNCQNTNLFIKLARVLFGLVFIFGGLALWVFAFYLPYAYYTLTFDYSYGQEPGFMAGMTFSMVVVAGNQLMYFICSMVADNARFIYVDDREVCYMLLFCFACVFNVLLDLVTTYFVAYRINVGLGMKTYHGTPLADLKHFTEIFETYAMQRRLAESLWAYAFPSTFLIPFLIEPVVTILVPYQLMVSIVSRQPRIKGFVAERLMVGLVMDLSRYADLLLNVMIGVLIFFFPGGYNVQVFMWLAVSHVYVYAMDQYRLLQSAQNCEFADNIIDSWAQWILSVPMGFIASCFVFKSNCEPGFQCFNGEHLVWACALAFFGHIALHTAMLLLVVPCFSRDVRGDGAESTPYKTCSEQLAASWFSANPIFCLRSEFIYEHNPPAKYCVPGKEHLQQKNPSIGAYFSDNAAAAEDFDESPMASMSSFKDVGRKAMRTFSPTRS